MSKTLIAAAGAGLCFIGYCIYFDRKRRSDPDFKKKLREKRKKARQQKTQPRPVQQFPDMNNHAAMQKFFLEQVSQGEELLSQGDIEGGVEHLSTAVAVCGQPQQLLQVLQQTLPTQIFHMLVQKLPAIGQRLMASNPGYESLHCTLQRLMTNAAASASGEGPRLEEDDLE